jgi:MFS family permease
MDQQAREQAFVNALATEHFVLQAARSAIVGDQVGRATIYIGAVSGALIAFGLLAQVVSRLDPFVIAVLPALFVLGELTFAAMWHNTVENLVLLRKMQAIRGYYRGLVPEASQFFDPPEADALHQAALGTVGLRVTPLQLLFTGASVVAAINSILGGAGLGLLAARLGQLGDSVAVVVGLAVAVILFGLHLLYQQRQSTLVGYDHEGGNRAG